MSAIIQPTRGNYWEIIDLVPGTTVFTLTETGEPKAWRAVRVEHTVLLFPDVEAAATWCIGARNQQLHLTRAHGWRLEWRGHLLKTTEYAIIVWWEELGEQGENHGPFLDLDVAIRRYFSGIDMPEKDPTT
jgi:hypothetical protein